MLNADLCTDLFDTMSLEFFCLSDCQAEQERVSLDQQNTAYMLLQGCLKHMQPTLVLYLYSIHYITYIHIFFQPTRGITFMLLVFQCLGKKLCKVSNHKPQGA